MDSYTYIAEESVKTLNTIANIAMWTLVSFIIAIAAGIMIYFMFLKNSNPASKNIQKIKDILDFKVMLIEPILKIVYIISTLFVILFSFGLITTSFSTFLIVLIVCPIGIRIIYELIMINIMIWKNTKEINENTAAKNNNETKSVKTKKD